MIFFNFYISSKFFTNFQEAGSKYDFIQVGSSPCVLYKFFADKNNTNSIRLVV